MKRHPADVSKDFKQYPFFKSFTDNLVIQIATMAEVKNFKSGEMILVEGQKNDVLYFLNQGSVDILLRGELLTSLNRKGEVLGEMSVISHLPVSTDIRATSDVECYTLDASDLSVVPVKDREVVQTLMYRIFADILTDRLRSTNNKARQFEITNRDLVSAQSELQKINSNLEQLVQERTKDLTQKTQELEVSFAKVEQQNMVLSTGFKKLSDLASDREKALHEIRNMIDQHIRPLQKVIENQVSKDIVDEVNFVATQMEKVSQYFSSEATKESHRVLLLESDRKQQLVAKMALGGTGVELEVISQLDQFQAQLEQGPYDLIFCDMALSEALKTAKNLNFKGEMVLVHSLDIKSAVNELRAFDFVGHMLTRDPDDRTYTVKSIVTTITKILNRDYFGLEKYLSWGVEVQELPLNNSDQRADKIQSMQESLKSLGVRGTLLERCGTVAEEMLMNAIYDAPTDGQGKSLFNHLARTEKVDLPAGQEVVLRFACDGNFVAVSVEDCYGSLPKKILLDYLANNYSDQAGQMNEAQEKGGAGRGLHQIIENSDLTVFNVRKGYKTEVISIFNIDSNKEKESRPTLHYFFR